MIKAPLTLTAIMLIAALPNLSAAQSVATSLSVSFGDNDGSVILGPDGLPTGISAPSSISFASASGPFAAASSVATGNSTGAVAGASDTSDFAPFVDVTLNGQTNAYETSVIFPPQN